jgi:DNA-binding MarR family transcriptional regulator
MSWPTPRIGDFPSSRRTSWKSCSSLANDASWQRETAVLDVVRDPSQRACGARATARGPGSRRSVIELRRALQTVGRSLPQMEILTVLISATGPVKPAALAGRLMLERSTVSRNLTLMKERGWITAVETSPTGRAMSVTITETGLAAFTSASTAWRSAQTSAAALLGPAAATMLDQWLDLHAETPASRSDA